MLESYIDVQIIEIEKDDEKVIHELPYGMDIIYRINEDSTYLSSLTERYQFVKPGISDANVTSLFYQIIINRDAHLEYNKLCDVLSDYFIREFGEKNLLYATCDRKEDSNVFYFFTFPLSRRTLDPRPWTFKGKMIGIKETKFISYIEAKFELKEEEKEENKYITDDPRALEDMRELEYVVPISGTAQTDMPYEDIMNIFHITYRYFSTVERHIFDEARKHLLEPDKFLKEVENYLKRNHQNLSKKDIKFVINEMYNAIYDYHVLTPLINDPNIQDIKVLKTGKIRVKVNGQRMTANARFESREDYENFVEGIAYRHNIDLSENAMSHFVDTDGNPNFLLRFNISTTYVASNPVSYIHIRKIAKVKPTINELIEKNMLTKELALWFIEQAKKSTGIIFVGRGGSGKTTLMNVLLEYIPYTRSAMVIQDNEELFTDNHPDIMFLHTVESKGVHYDNPIYDLKAISKNGLLVDIDYFIIGEIKGAEAMYFLNASATGATCWASLHSSYARLDKLADYVMYESKYDRKQALIMLQNLEYVVYMDHYQVKEIARVKPWNEELQDLEYEQVYNYKTGLKKERKE